MAETVKTVRSATKRPLILVSKDPAVLAAGAAARVGGQAVEREGRVVHLAVAPHRRVERRHRARAALRADGGRIDEAEPLGARGRRRRAGLRRGAADRHRRGRRGP